ncbi:MAG: diacylglycerol kinase [Aequorivita sp.]|nr:MAG: diacylglycerol kinase [Aequorivita sp.]
MKSENYILLVVNPIAGDSDKTPIITEVEYKVSQRDYNLKIYETTGDNDKEAIDSLIKEYKPSRIIVAGGDGTISLVAECVYEKEIILGIIPAGSANGMAVNFGLPETIKEQIAIALSDWTLKVDVLFINGRMCLHIADLGINAELVKNYESSGVRGKWGYFLQSIPTLINSESPFHFTIETGEGMVNESGVLLAIANANKFGTGATINPNGKINDGIFEILIFKNLDFIEIFKTINDKPDMSSDFVQVISTENAIIRSTKKIPFQIDGEFIGEIDEVKVSVAQEKLLVALPEKFCKLYTLQN